MSSATDGITQDAPVSTLPGCPGRVTERLVIRDVSLEYSPPGWHAGAGRSKVPGLEQAAWAMSRKELIP